MSVGSCNICKNTNLQMHLFYRYLEYLIIFHVSSQLAVRIFTFTLLVGNCRECILIIDEVLTIPFQVTHSVNLLLQIAYAVRMQFGIMVLNCCSACQFIYR